MRQVEEKEKQMRERFEGVIPVCDWCHCGHCALATLQNPAECICCTEMNGCTKSFQSELVMREVENPPSCVTDHPGFREVCLGRWSLRLASWAYRTKEKRRYKQTGSENGFLRSVAYREFTRLIHGHLGSQRIPLPACAYNAIRKKFSTTTDQFTGYSSAEDSTSDSSSEESSLD